MAEFLNQTKNKRKENYDFLSQIMRNHQIKLETLESPQQSIQSSQFTDQVIRIVNSKQSLQSISSQIKESDRQISLTDEVPIIQEIDTILARIKNKYSSPNKSPNQIKNSPNSNITIREEEDNDYVLQIKQRIEQKQTNKQITQQKQYQQQQQQQVQQKNNLKVDQQQQHLRLKQEDILLQDNKSSKQINEIDEPIEESEQKKKTSNVKEQVKRLQNSFKSSSSQKPPQHQNVIAVSNVKEINVEEFHMETMAQDIIIETDKGQPEYVTPKKQNDGFSQLSYSQSNLNSNLQSEIYTQQKANEDKSERKSGNYPSYYNDSILQNLIQEELELMHRLQSLQKMLEMEKNQN